LLKVKNNLQITQPWEITYFARFLYNSYPTPGREFTTLELSEGRRNRHIETKEQTEMREFAEFLKALQANQKIDGEQFRVYRDQWTKQPNDRETLTQRLKKL
jgi:hypothetical protein